MYNTTENIVSRLGCVVDFRFLLQLVPVVQHLKIVCHVITNFISHRVVHQRGGEPLLSLLTLLLQLYPSSKTPSTLSHDNTASSEPSSNTIRQIKCIESMSNNNSSSAPFDFNTFLQKSDQTPTGPMKSTPSHPGTSLPVSQNQKVVHYDTSANTVPEAPQPTATLPIAHYTSTEPGFPYSGSLIAVNQQYICYVTKGGLIRVIDRRNAARTLLRGHGAGKTVKNTQIVYDLQFFSSSSDVLATVGGIGETGKSGVIVWRIFSTVGNMESIQSEKMLQINFPANRLVWHPFTPNMFLVLRENNSTGHIDKDNSSQLFEAVQIETTKLLTLSHPTEGHAVCDAFLPSPSGENNPSGDRSVADIIQPLFGARMRGHNGALTDVCWSQDATQAFTCDTEGVVKVWDLTMASHTTDKLGTILVTCVLTVQAENPGVSLSRVFSLPNFNLSQGMAPRRDFVPSFVSTSQSNTKVTLWAPTLQMNEFPQKLQTIVFDQTQVEQPLRFNAMHCNCLGPNTSGELHFFMFSDKTNGRLYSVHLAKSGNRFDFVTPFKLLHPVFSWSSLVSALDVQEFLDLSGEELSRNSTGQAQPGSEISLFCVQDKAVQQIKLLPSICFPSYAESVSVSYAVSLNDEKADNDDFQAEEYDLGDDVIEEEVPETDHNVVTSGLPPGLDIFPAEQKSDEASGGAFSNWLGSIISGKAAIPEPIKAVSPSPAPIIDSEQNNGSSGHLLTPEEVMSKHVNQEPIPDLEKNKDSAESKLKETSDMKQPKAVKKQPKSRDATPPPVGKISILKREDKQISVESLSKTAISGDGDLEALLNKVVSSSLKRRDAQLHAEIQKTIKNEINESVIPALGKCVTQTIENTVTKPLQVALANKSKEGSQLKTKEVVKAITESMSKPVSDAFENVSNDFVKTYIDIYDETYRYTVESE